MMDRFEPKYPLYSSIEEMLSPAVVSDLLKQTISWVEIQPFQSADGWSGNLLYQVQANDNKLYLKCLRPSLDWISIATDDHRCRSVTVWQYGLLDRIRPHIDHAILAGSQDEDGYALLMYDVSHGFLTPSDFSRPLTHNLLDSLAAMHAIYWEDDRLADSALGLATAEILLTCGWPKNLHRYSHDTRIMDLVAKGWDALFDLLEHDVCAALQTIMDKPEPLIDKLSQFPRTFLHSDYRLSNIALLPENNQVVAFDWQSAAYAPATICLCWFTMTGEVFSWQAEAAEYYKLQLAQRLGSKFDPAIWQPMLDLGILVDVLRKGSWHAMFSTNHPDQDFRAQMLRCVHDYNDLVHKAIRWL